MVNARNPEARNAWLRLLAIGGLVAATAAPGIAAMSKKQLLSLIDGQVDPGVIVQLIERDCVDFDLTPEVILELSKVAPSEVLSAAIACKGTAEEEEEEQPAPRPSSQRAPEAFDLSDIDVLAVVPATFDGDTDDALTIALIHELRMQRPRYRLVDPFEMEDDFDDEDEFDAGAPVRTLLPAARRRGAQAILLVTGTSFRRLEDPGVNLDLKLVETNRGKVVWSGGASGLSDFFSWHGAKRNAVSRAVRALP